MVASAQEPVEQGRPCSARRGFTLGSSSSQGGRWPMPRAKRTLFSSVIAVFASSFATALPQDGVNGRAPVGRPGAVAQRGQPKAAAPNPIQIDDLLTLWERQSTS